MVAGIVRDRLVSEGERQPDPLALEVIAATRSRSSVRNLSATTLRMRESLLPRHVS